MQRIIDQTSLGKKCDGINGVIKHHLEKIQVMVLMMKSNITWINTCDVINGVITYNFEIYMWYQKTCC